MAERAPNGMTMHETPATYPFWCEPQAELELERIGLSEVFLECLDEEMVGLEWLVRRGAVRKGETLALVHTARRTLDVKAPFALEVVEVNEEALADARQVRDAPYGEGWLAMVRPLEKARTRL